MHNYSMFILYACQKERYYTLTHWLICEAEILYGINHLKRRVEFHIDSLSGAMLLPALAFCCPLLVEISISKYSLFLLN